jgi:hypothetical protein
MFFHGDLSDSEQTKIVADFDRGQPRGIILPDILIE